MHGGARVETPWSELSHTRPVARADLISRIRFLRQKIDLRNLRPRAARKCSSLRHMLAEIEEDSENLYAC